MLTNYEKAQQLINIGCYVFPFVLTEVKGKLTKRPITAHGLLDASNEPEVVRDWFENHPERHVGVNAGMSGLVCIDIDTKNGKDGWTSLTLAWVETPETVTYETQSGGTHLIYQTDRNDLQGNEDYRGMAGVDRRAGSSFFGWWGDTVPASRDAFTAAPEWTLDPKKKVTQHVYSGTVQEWYDRLTAGDPNAVVRHAIERIPEGDFGHEEMVDRQHEAIRLGSEGHPGVRELLDTLKERFLARPDTHTRPPEEWPREFDEAFEAGIAKFGEESRNIKSLRPYSLDLLPAKLPTNLVVGEPFKEKRDWFNAIRRLCEAIPDDTIVATLAWYGPALKAISREWGLDFVMQQIEEQRKKMNMPLFDARPPEPNLTPDEKIPDLMSDVERDTVGGYLTFTDVYLAVGKKGGAFVNETMFRAASWNILSMAFAFRGFIPVSTANKPGLNIWLVSLSHSGSGKTFANALETQVLDALFQGDNDEAPYWASDQVSPAGLHAHLLRRDNMATVFASDEASGFFEKLAVNDYMRGLNDDMAKYYDGSVPPANKVGMKDLKGKSAHTHFNMHLHATPDRFFSKVTREMFLSGFLARVNWSIGEKREDDPDSIVFTQTLDIPTDINQLHPNIAELVVDLNFIASTYGDPKPVIATDEALDRMQNAMRDMVRAIQNKANYDILQPAIQRLGYETLRKVAALSALWRGSTTIDLFDVWVALRPVQEWFTNLFVVTQQVSSTMFAKSCEEMEAYIRARGKVVRNALFNRFGGTIQRDTRELDQRLGFLLEAGKIARKDEDGKVYYYAI